MFAALLLILAAAPPQRVEMAVPATDLLIDTLAPPVIINPTTVTVAEARAGVAQRPRDADAWHQLGESLQVAGDDGEAVAAFRRATQVPPRVIGRAYLYRELAGALERTGDIAGALAAARTALRSWPLSRDRLYCTTSEAVTMTRLLVRSGDLAGAAAFWRGLNAVDPERADCRRVQEMLDEAAGP